MSYWQGTIVFIDSQFTDPDTNLPFDPPDVFVTIMDPDGREQIVKLSEGTVQRRGPGLYRCPLDTTPMAGSWEYQPECTGPRAVVGERVKLRVKPRLRV